GVLRHSAHLQRPMQARAAATARCHAASIRRHHLIATVCNSCETPCIASSLLYACSVCALAPRMAAPAALRKFGALAVWPPIAVARDPFGPCTCTVASSAAVATFMSDGLVAMQLSLVPRTASVRLLPVIAGQPVPGSRLLRGITVSRKYMHRVRWSRLPAVVAMLRSCAEAPARRACDNTA